MIPQKPRTIILYGRSGMGKTSNLKMLAKWFWEKYKQKIRLITSDGGGARPFYDSDKLVEKGIVEICDNTDRELALQDIHRLADGCWINGKGEIERDINLGGGINQPINKAYRTKLFERLQVGAYFIEGTGSLSQALLSHFSDKLTQEERIGFKPGWTYQEGDYAVAGLEPGHYGIVQRELHKLVVRKFCQLPVKLVVFTGHVTLGIEVTSKQKKNGEKFATATGDPLYGPSGPGVALTGLIPSWFENCLYLQSYKVKNKEGKILDRRRAWYREHTEKIMMNGTPTDVPFLAKSSCPIERLEEVETRFPGGWIPLGTRGIDSYVEWLEEIET